MSSRLTLYRIRNKPWKLWPITGLAWGSMWQLLLEPQDTSLAYLSLSNMICCLLVLVAMLIASKSTSKAVERWALLGIIWSMSCYLAEAVASDGYMALIKQPNLGIVLSEAVVLASIHTIVWTLTSRFVHRHRVKCEARKIVSALKESA